MNEMMKNNLTLTPWVNDLRLARNRNTRTGGACRRKVAEKARRCLSLPPKFGLNSKSLRHIAEYREAA